MSLHFLASLLRPTFELSDLAREENEDAELWMYTK